MIYEPCIILKPEMLTIADTARVDSLVKIEGGLGVTIGEYVHIASFCHINGGGGRVVLGNHVGLGSGAKIIGGCNRPDALSMSAASPAGMQHVARQTTILHDYAFVGTNGIVMPGVTLGEGAVLGAGAVATHDIPPWEVWAGIPARRIGLRTRPVEAP
jgi:acetyltransferase-like isoleucine patch superfamily enzyme